MLKQLLAKLKVSKTKKSNSSQTHDMGLLKKSQNCHKDGKLIKNKCKCEPTACKCGKRKQQQQQQQQYRSLLLSQLRRRGADNLSSVILF
ncbi:PREDICTED: uncharacterized protein LOC108609947 isoform X2 [Drosophila arizonae]|uniref:Uncharacterized protein LOC108609947 isoform X2 n=1 Tax=Drosophila arizonae TaxID=7263 RepID=A0ABM1NQI9_DROAR|nr:PREDICTED: uncharacterized protein LOC108609947 isoform X2 [Drosophila arizonae]